MLIEEKLKIKESIINILMCNGDGHTDAYLDISDYIESILDGNSEEWEKKFYDKNRAILTNFS